MIACIDKVRLILLTLPSVFFSFTVLDDNL